ncbi:MAG: hypothetical protein J5905_04505 [Prevotella sp.]|nr:hypothetical protein [Prevotella sp.]
MKKILFSALCGLAMITTSCDNDDILIEADNNVNEVNVNVSLSGLFSSYNYNDTQHDESVTEDFRTFNSEFGKYIHVRTLFYNSQGNLVKELSSFSTNTNTVSNSAKLAEGTYTVISILNFADDQTEEDSWWDFYEKEKLSTAYIRPYGRFSKWCIMSYASQSISVTAGRTTNISMTPAPVGALGYMFAQNFQYKNEASFGTVADNGVRSIALYSQKVAEGYKIDPNASEKFIYKEATGTGSWYFLSNELTPSSFSSSKDYGYFRTNLISYFYILAPSFNATFGYMLEGESGFNGYGEANYTITNGQTYLAYWDWFQVGNPYFGVADNNHWNTYSSSQSLSIPFDIDVATHDK